MLQKQDNWVRVCFPKQWKLITEFKCPLCEKEITLTDVYMMPLDVLKEYTHSRTCESCYKDIELYKRNNP